MDELGEKVRGKHGDGIEAIVKGATSACESRDLRRYQSAA
jgi:hypothetical protein